MGQSTVAEWLNENENRAYPLTASSSRLLTFGSITLDLYTIFVDANLVYTAHPVPDSIDLQQIAYVGDNLTITIKDNAPFVVNNLTAKTFPLYVTNSENSLIVLGVRTEDLFAVADITVNVSNVSFEPSVAIELRNDLAGVSSIELLDSVGNSIGTISSGQITLIEGYQMDIQIIGQTIQLTVGRSEGQPLNCQDFFSGQLPNDCGDIISFINGASPRDNGGRITLKAGDHVKIFEDKDRGRIYIGLDFDPADTCQPTTIPPR